MSKGPPQEIDPTMKYDMSASDALHKIQAAGLQYKAQSTWYLPILREFVRTGGITGAELDEATQCAKVIAGRAANQDRRLRLRNRKRSEDKDLSTGVGGGQTTLTAEQNVASPVIPLYSLNQGTSRPHQVGHGPGQALHIAADKENGNTSARSVSLTQGSSDHVDVFGFPRVLSNDSDRSPSTAATEEHGLVQGLPVLSSLSVTLPKLGHALGPRDAAVERVSSTNKASRASQPGFRASTRYTRPQTSKLTGSATGRSFLLKNVVHLTRPHQIEFPGQKPKLNSSRYDLGRKSLATSMHKKLAIEFRSKVFKTPARDSMPLKSLRIDHNRRLLTAYELYGTPNQKHSRTKAAHSAAAPSDNGLITSDPIASSMSMSAVPGAYPISPLSVNSAPAHEENQMFASKKSKSTKEDIRPLPHLPSTIQGEDPLRYTVRDSAIEKLDFQQIIAVAKDAGADVFVPAQYWLPQLGLLQRRPDMYINENGRKVPRPCCEDCPRNAANESA